MGWVGLVPDGDGVAGAAKKPKAQARAPVRGAGVREARTGESGWGSLVRRWGRGIAEPARRGVARERGWTGVLLDQAARVGRRRHLRVR